MIDLYYWPTPNGHKITMALEELGLEYRIHPVNIGAGDQFKPEFLAISPNNRMPAIVDNAPAQGGPPISIFESGAILLYLAEKTGRLIPEDIRGRVDVLQWLFWQVGNLGPMAGQNGHFNVYAPEKVPYAITRYTNDYSIADIASYPWIVPYASHGQNLDDFPHLKRWFEAIKARPATIRAYEGVAPSYSSATPMSEEARRILFNQTAASVR